MVCVISIHYYTCNTSTFVTVKLSAWHGCNKSIVVVRNRGHCDNITKPCLAVCEGELPAINPFWRYRAEPSPISLFFFASIRDRIDRYVVVGCGAFKFMYTYIWYCRARHDLEEDGVLTLESNGLGVNSLGWVLGV